MCYNDSLSEWSDSVRFYVPSSGQWNESVGVADNNYVYLMPNPAGENVTIASSYRMRLIELYTLAGLQVMRQDVDALATELNLANLSPGTYLLRIVTSNGTAFKKLVKK